jgi:hypothetical protein
MTKAPVLIPIISDLLDDFFAGYQPNAPVAVQARIDTVRRDLEQQLDLEGPRILTTGQLAILNTEKQFDPVGAFARTMHADDLYYALERYAQPAHAFEDASLRETQLDVVAALAASLWRSPFVSAHNVSECTVIELEIALKRGREKLKRR